MTAPKPKRKTVKRSGPSKRGGAKSAAQLSKIGPSRPAGPSRDVRTAEGRGGSKISDARTIVRRDIGLGDAAPAEDTRRFRRDTRGGMRQGGGGQGIRKAPPRGAAIGVDLGAPAPDTVFKDLDKQPVTFPDSNLKRVAARLLSEKNKPWRYRPFPFPLFSDKGHEQTFYFDFYIYDNMDQVMKLILVTPRESAEVWDKIGRFKRQYPMFSYELWTPEKLAQLQKPRAQLGF